MKFNYKVLGLFLLCWVSGTRVATGQDAVADWSGNFEGYMQGSRTVFSIEQSGARISGKIVDDNGYTYTIEADIEGVRARGTLHDPQTGGSMELEAVKQGDEINLSLYQLLFETRISEVQLTYTRLAEGAETAKPATPAPAANLDARLIGAWRYTSAYVSGDFSVASDYNMRINADGTYQYGDARIAGGGSSGTFDSGTGGATTGHVMTQNKQIYVNEGYGWQFYANYMCDGARLLLTFQNGNKQIWERVD